MTTAPTARPYTPADDAFIRDRAGKTSWSAIGAMLGRSADGVKNRAVILGLANTGCSESVVFQSTMRAANEQFVSHLEKIHRKRGWAIRNYRERPGA